ncbi:YciI family protein [Pinisolibacter sp.]|uniref:YciI family protein n=1 Tax=Pinisolibacter sp. TaxID=2172024 RepID=UPI002FDD22E5
MLFAAMCHDKPDHLAVRLATRDAHVAWLKGMGAKVRIAGPFLDDTGEIMQGSIVVIEAETLAEAKATFATDPYAVAGLFADAEIRPWRWVVGAPTA